MVIVRGEGWEINSISAVLFDKDGTFVDSHVYWGEIIKRRSKEIIEAFNLPASCSQNVQRAMGYDSKSRMLLPSGPIALYPRDFVIEVVAKYLERFGINDTTEQVGNIFNKVHQEFLEDIADYIKLIPGFLNLLTSLAEKGVKLGVVTTDTVENTLESLKILAISDYFDAVVGKDSVKEHKETGLPATFALTILNTEPSKAICIGDAPMDIKMAHNAGCKAGIAVATGQIPYEELQKISRYSVKNLSCISVLNSQEI